MTWLKTGVPRAQFSQGALYEVGCAVTLFKVKNHEAEFLAFLYGGNQVVDPLVFGPVPDDSDEAATITAEEAPNAERIETLSRDFVVKRLRGQIDGIKFEHFIAHLLTCMGFRTQVTPASGDGGFDIIAHRDPLGLEPPIIKVQCKRTISAIGQPDVQKFNRHAGPRRQRVGSVRHPWLVHPRSQELWAEPAGPPAGQRPGVGGHDLRALQRLQPGVEACSPTASRLRGGPRA